MMGNVQKKSEISAIVTYGLIVGILAFFMLWNAEWLLGDQSQLMLRLPFGGHMSLKTGIFLDSGRFLPLIFFDYNILWLFNNPSCLAFFIVNVIGFFLTAVLLFLLLHHILNKNDFKGSFWIATIGSLLYLVGTYKVQLDLIYPERIMSLMIVSFVYFGLLFFEKKKWYFAVISILSASYATYCKEPFFGSLLVFALFNILFEKGLEQYKNKYLWIIIINSLFYILLYAIFIYPGIVSAWDGNRGETDQFAIILKGLCSQKLLILAIPIVLFRTYRFVFKDDRLHLFFDALLLAGLSYTFACVLLTLNDDYYYYPATLLLLIPVVYFLFYYVKSLWSSLILIPFLLFYIYELPSQIEQNQYLRKTTRPQIEELAQAYLVGTKIYFEPSSDLPNSWEDIVFNWHREILRSYMANIVNDVYFQFETAIPHEKYISIKHCPENEFPESPLSPYCIEFKNNVGVVSR